MQRQKPLDGLDFDNHRILDNQVKPITTVDPMFLIDHGQLHLASEANVPEPQFHTKAFFIGRFQQARAQCPMNLNGSTDDLLRQRISLCLCGSWFYSRRVSRPDSAISAAASWASALFCVSCHSEAGSESATMPAPA